MARADLKNVKLREKKKDAVVKNLTNKLDAMMSFMTTSKPIVQKSADQDGDIDLDSSSKQEQQQPKSKITNSKRGQKKRKSAAQKALDFRDRLAEKAVKTNTRRLKTNARKEVWN